MDEVHGCRSVSNRAGRGSHNIFPRGGEARQASTALRGGLSPLEVATTSAFAGAEAGYASPSLLVSVHPQVLQEGFL